MKYDDEEKFILDAMEKDDITLSNPSKDELKDIKAAANRTFKKNQRVTIRLYDHDFAGIQKKALEIGMPYQTLISALIHRYVEGDIKIKPA
jgi:predicted DNA binding CopG/RHH family protein